MAFQAKEAKEAVEDELWSWGRQQSAQASWGGPSLRRKPEAIIRPSWRIGAQPQLTACLGQKGGLALSALGIGSGWEGAWAGGAKETASLQGQKDMEAEGVPLGEAAWCHERHTDLELGGLGLQSQL